jgi:hypothetical protein
MATDSTMIYHTLSLDRVGRRDENGFQEKLISTQS